MWRAAPYGRAKRRQRFGKVASSSAKASDFFACGARLSARMVLRTQQRSRSNIVIVGGGLAGQRCAAALRREGHTGAIRMVCAEAHPPYDRPPLSKEVLSGARSAWSLAYRPGDWYEQHAVELLLGLSATALWPSDRRLRLHDGSTLSYDQLLIATGCRPRRLPLLAGYENVSTLRTIDDCVALQAALQPGARLVVIGAGFIGQEVAATALKLGAQVTMIEAAEQPLIGVLGQQLGAWFAAFHRSHGVELLCGRTLMAVEGGRWARRLRLSDGRVVRADHVVVGVGVEPEIKWLKGSGFDSDRGVQVDGDGRTTAGGVFAAGDAAATFDPLLGCYVSGSHWEAAAGQAARAARAMLGREPGRSPVASFWTDQYGIRIQYLGHARLAENVVVDGDLGAPRFTATFTRSGAAVGALLVDRPRDLPTIRNLIEKGPR